MFGEGENAAREQQETATSATSLTRTRRASFGLTRWTSNFIQFVQLPDRFSILLLRRNEQKYPGLQAVLGYSIATKVSVGKGDGRGRVAYLNSGPESLGRSGVFFDVLARESRHSVRMARSDGGRRIRRRN